MNASFVCYFQIRPNEFRLRMPVWITDLQFIDERNRCLVSTGHHQVRYFILMISNVFYSFVFNRFVYMILNQVLVDLFMKLNSNNVRSCLLLYFIHRIMSSLIHNEFSQESNFFFLDASSLVILMVKWVNSILNVYLLPVSFTNTVE